MAVEVGSAYVSIVPSFKNFGSSLQSGIGNEGARIGQTVASQIGDGVNKAAPGTVHKSVRDSIKGAGDAGAAEGRSTASRISGSLLGGLKGLGPSLIATAGLGAITVTADKAIEKYESLTKSAMKSSRELGVSISDASRLNFAFRQSGLDVDGASTSLKKFSTFLTNNKDASKTLGFEIRNTNGQIKPMGELLKDTAAKFATMPNGAEKTALAVQLFGRAGLQMLPFLNKGAEGIQALMDKSDKLGLTIGDQDAKDIKEHIAAQRAWQAASEALQFQIGKGLAPVLTAVANWLSTTGVPALISVGHVFGEIGEFAVPLVTGAVDSLGKVIQPIFAALGAGITTMVEAFKSGGDEVTKSGFAGFMERVGITARTVFTEVKGGIAALVAAFNAGGSDVTSSGFAGFMERLGLAARGLFDWLRSTGIPALKEFAAFIGPILGEALKIAWSAVKELASVIIPTFDFIADHSTIFEVVGAAVLAGVIAFKAYNAVLALSAAATDLWAKRSVIAQAIQKAWTAVMAVFNAVTDANPIMLIVIAIAALVAAFVVAYNKSDTFRAIVQGALHAVADAASWMWNVVLKPTWDALVAAWNAVAGFFAAAWNNVLKPVFDVIGIVVSLFWEGFKLYFGFVWSIVKGVFEAIAVIWDNVLHPVFNVIAAVVGWLAETVFQVALGMIKFYWNGLVATFTLLWNTVLHPVFNAIAAVATWLWQNVAVPVFNGIKAEWNALMFAMNWLWANVLHPAFNAIAAVATWLWQNVAVPVFNGIKSAWNGLVDGIKWMWDNVLHPVFTTVENVIATAAANVGRAWDGLKSAFSNAFSAAKQAVVDGWNAIAGWVDDNVIGKINATFAIHIPALPRFATGGFVSGPGGGTSDSIMARLSNGEFVMRADAVKAIGVDTLNALNESHRIRYTGGDESGLSFLPGYADGGLVGDTKAWIQSQAGKPYSMGATGPGAWDCSGLVGAVWAMLNHRDPYRRYFSTVNEGDGFFKPGLGGEHAFNVGWYGGGGDSGHTVGQLDGMFFEATPPHVLVGRTNYTPSSGLFSNRGHIDVGGTQTAWGWLYEHTVGEIRAALTSAMGGVVNHLPQLGMMTDVLRGISERAISTLSFDGGGLLPQGTWLVDHNKSEPDRVLSSDQWKVAARALDASTGKPSIVINVNPRAEHSEQEIAASVQRELAWSMR